MRARVVGEQLEICLVERGPGIAPQEPTRVFEALVPVEAAKP